MDEISGNGEQGNAQEEQTKPTEQKPVVPTQTVENSEITKESEDQGSHPDETAKKTRTFKLMTGPDWVTAIATVMIFLATATYVWYARRQWQAMSGQLTAMQGQLTEMKSQSPQLQKSADAAKTAADAAQSQVDLMRQQLAASSAAILRFEPPLASSEPNLQNFGVTFRNVGHANATNIHASMDISVRSIPDNKQIGTTRSISKDVPTLTVAPLYPLDANLSQYEWEVLRPLSSQELTMISDGNAAISVDFSVSYYDGFNRRSFKSCYSHMSFSITVSPGSKVESSPSVPCEELPKAMADFEAAKANAEKEKAQHPN